MFFTVYVPRSFFHLKKKLFKTYFKGIRRDFIEDT